jgi:hypothetical protein
MESNMKSFIFCLISGMALALPIAASAQPNAADTRYCSVLSDDYDRYTSAGQDHRGHSDVTPNIAVAMTECQSDPVAAIAVLEKALTDAKIPLPPRG